jgi:hypothetical protein
MYTHTTSVLDAIGYPWKEEEDGSSSNNEQDETMTSSEYEERLRNFALQSRQRNKDKEAKAGTKISIFMVRDCPYGNGLIHLIQHRPNIHHLDQVTILCEDSRNEVQKQIETTFSQLFLWNGKKEEEVPTPLVVLETRGIVSYLSCEDVLHRLNHPVETCFHVHL